jgi:anti-repressor protein
MIQDIRITPSEAPTITELVVITNNRAVTTSLKVAEVFGKQHFHVMRDIRNLIAQDPDLESNFGCVEIIEKNSIGGSVDRSYYTMDRDGFTLLAFGFTGKRALEFKKQYIAAFNKMEATLKSATEMSDDQKILTLAKGVIELTAWMEEAQPKVAYYDRFVDPKGALPLPTIAEQLSWDPEVFIEQLRRDKFIYRHHGTDVPFQRYIENGVLRLFLNGEDGHGNVTGQTRATVKGALILACEYGTAAERAEAKQQLKQLRRQQRLREAGAAGGQAQTEAHQNLGLENQHGGYPAGRPPLSPQNDHRERGFQRRELAPGTDHHGPDLRPAGLAAVEG